MNIEKGLKHLKKKDEKMGRLITKFEKPEFKKDNNYFEALVRAIVYQQLSGKAAATIYERLKDLFTENKFLLPSIVMEKSHEELRSVGLSNQKASYIHNIANAFYTGTIPKNINAIDDNEVIKKVALPEADNEPLKDPVVAEADTELLKLPAISEVDQVLFRRG